MHTSGISSLKIEYSRIRWSIYLRNSERIGSGLIEAKPNLHEILSDDLHKTDGTHIEIVIAVSGMADKWR